MVNFISYDGSYPNLCSGDLIIEVNGKRHKLESPLSSGGSVSFTEDWDEIVTDGEWYVNVPDELKEYAEEITEVINSNVSYGCCGGCI
jgi:hypothetical protein